ncbi:hypothetical protein QN355_09270, partial [Cryobacterium sp. 10S3]|uniref:hypothetical protein n=1 Tax=Cryobacterium sp. 10S3 TaxID=3048582 RepID=UPI002B22CB27
SQCSASAGTNPCFPAGTNPRKSQESRIYNLMWEKRIDFDPSATLNWSTVLMAAGHIRPGTLRFDATLPTDRW